SLQDAQGRPSALREPAYPLLLGSLFQIFGRSYAAALGANCTLGVLTLWLLFALGRALYGGRVARLALAIGAFYPPFIYYAAQPMRETAPVFWVVLSLWCLERAVRLGSAAGFAGAGAAAALAALTKATLLPFALLLVPLGIIFIARRERVPARRWCASYLAVFIALYGLWPLRNRLVMGRAVWGNTEGGGCNLYQYLVVPQELGGTAAQTEILAADPVYAAANRLDGAARDRFLWRAAGRRIRQKPWAYAKLVAWRFFWDEWRLSPRPRTYDHPYRVLRWISLLSDGWIIPLGLLGIFLSRLRPPGSLWPCLLLFSEVFVYALVFSMIRYRLARMPVLILFAAVALDRTWCWCRTFPKSGRSSNTCNT
ncbi:MAG: glycosyltransferase family 39 protein, partial [Elusimicrobia bacterium]|nr:glycosyltransferase family 39 protein [Elusimicrobiota bacterium]